MEEKTKGRLISLGKIVFHGSVTCIIVIIILRLWSESIYMDDMEWNMFSTLAHLGGACLIVLLSMFLHLLEWKYRYVPKVE